MRKKTMSENKKCIAVSDVHLGVEESNMDKFIDFIETDRATDRNKEGFLRGYEKYRALFNARSLHRDTAGRVG
jgi:metallophosphoesterase superfamily enzyme